MEELHEVDAWRSMAMIAVVCGLHHPCRPVPLVIENGE